MIKEHPMERPWSSVLGPVEPSQAESLRAAVAQALRATAAHLLAWASRWQPAQEQISGATPCLEFHAEAGAPEGALYLNGERIGVLPGVTRL
jgi:hypothetical protein